MADVKQAEDARYPLGWFCDLVRLAAEDEFGEGGELWLTRLELSRAALEALDSLGRLECVWCGVDTADIDEWYAVVDAVWEEFGPVRGCLCVGCLEDRMGRRLVPADFSGFPINSLEYGEKSDRLRDRLGFGPSSELERRRREVHCGG